MKKCSPAKIRVESYIDTAQSQPARQTREHPVGREARNVGARAHVNSRFA
jgi:hypothetical protein